MRRQFVSRPLGFFQLLSEDTDDAQAVEADVRDNEESRALIAELNLVEPRLLHERRQIHHFDDVSTAPDC